MIEDKRKIVTQILGSYWQKGDEHLYHCPYCGHHKKKMSINFSNGYWKCWVCDTRGKNIYRIVRKFGNYQQRQKYRELQGLVDLTDFEEMFKEYNNIQEKQISTRGTVWQKQCTRQSQQGRHKETQIPASHNAREVRTKM